MSYDPISFEGMADVLELCQRFAGESLAWGAGNYDCGYRDDNPAFRIAAMVFAKDVSALIDRMGAKPVAAATDGKMYSYIFLVRGAEIMLAAEGSETDYPTLYQCVEKDSRAALLL